MENRFYVYLLLDPVKLFLPFYVGKGTGTRAYDHLRPGATRKTHPKNSRIKSIRAQGYEPKVMIWKTDLLEQEALELEEELILRYGRKNIHPDGLLTNMTDGGHLEAGQVFSAEHRAKIGAAHKGKPKSEEHCRKISETKKGKPLSETTKKKLSDQRKGKGCGAENPMFGRAMSEVDKEYRRIRMLGEKNPNYGKQHSAEAMKKIIAANLGRKHSAESKALISEKLRARVKTQCPHCERSFDPGNYARLHGDKCKMK